MRWGWGAIAPAARRSSSPAGPRPARPRETCWAASVFGPIFEFRLLQRDADAFGVVGRPPVRRGDGSPAVEHEVTVVVAVAAGNRRGVGHVGGDLPERDDWIPAHRRGA